MSKQSEGNAAVLNPLSKLDLETERHIINFYKDNSAGREKLADDCYNQVLGRASETDYAQDDDEWVSAKLDFAWPRCISLSLSAAVISTINAVGQVQILKFQVDYTSALSDVWPKRCGRELAMFPRSFWPIVPDPKVRAFLRRQRRRSYEQEN